MNDYWKRLKNHPGVPMASALSIAGIVAAAASEHGDWRVGLLVSVFWIPVLLTARTQPLPKEPPR